MGLLDKFKKNVKEDIVTIDLKREELENKAAAILEKISKNKTFTKLENEGADKLVAMGIEAGIALAESAVKQDIPVDQTVIDNIADKGGDGLVHFIKNVTKEIVKQLRK